VVSHLGSNERLAGGLVWTSVLKFRASRRAERKGEFIQIEKIIFLAIYAIYAMLTSICDRYYHFFVMGSFDPELEGIVNRATQESYF
jgi:hypothetical protein